MVDIINMLLLKKFEEPCLSEDSGEFVSRWLTNTQNHVRLQRECDKIWIHQFEDEHYDAERAFRLLSLRVYGISKMETDHSTSARP
jgi:hypothetical protein